MKEKQRTNYRELFNIFLISLSASVFAKLLIDFIAGFATSFVAYDFDIKSFYDLTGVTFITDKTSPLWHFDAQVSILLTKPIVSMFAGLFALAGLILIKRKLISFFFLLFWLNLYAFNNSAGILIDDIIAKTGFYDVSVLFKFNNQILIITAVVAIYTLYKIGIVNTLAYRTSIGTHFNQSLKSKILSLLVLLLIPWAFNFLALYLQSHSKPGTLLLLQNTSMLILFIPFFFYRPNKKIVSKVEIIPGVLPFDWLNVLFYVAGSLILLYSLNHGVYNFSV